MTKTKVSNVLGLMSILLVALIALSIFQTYQLASISSKIGTGGTSGGGSSGSSVSADDIIREITPTGTPDYGKAAGVSYDNVEAGLNTLVGYQKSISLSGADQQRYIEVANTPNTACEYCCSIGNKGFGTAEGQIACGCSHNIAFGGLTKWLIKNSDYSDAEIVEEIQKWKILFFPQASLENELKERNINPTAVGLPSMVGGC